MVKRIIELLEMQGSKIRQKPLFAEGWKKKRRKKKN